MSNQLQTTGGNGTAITPYSQLKSLIMEDSNTEAMFTRALGPDNAPAFMASILNVVASSTGLQKCEPNSILLSAAKAAVLDLPIEPNLGLAFIIPYKSKATFQIGYKGLIQLALRTGEYARLNAAPLYEGQELTINQLTGAFELTGARQSDVITGYAAYFLLKSGLEKVFYMSKEQIKAHAQKYSKSANEPNGPWVQEFDKMALKTVLKLLLGKYGLVTIKMRRAEQLEESTEGSFAEVFAEAQEDFEGATIIDYQEPDEEAPEAEVVELDSEGNPIAAKVYNLKAPLAPDDFTTYYAEAGKYLSKEEARDILKGCNNNCIEAMGKVASMIADL